MTLTTENNQATPVVIQMGDIDKVDATQDITEEPIVQEIKEINSEDLSNDRASSTITLESNPRHSDTSNSLTSSKRRAFFEKSDRNKFTYLMAGLFLLLSAAIILTILAVNKNLYPNDQQSNPSTANNDTTGHNHTGHNHQDRFNPHSVRLYD